MRYRIVAVGRPGRRFVADGCRFYSDRLSKLAAVETVEVRAGRGADADEVRAKEATALRAQCDGQVVALDERGRAWSSEALAAHVAELELRGVSRMSLLIGGAAGLDRSLRDGADARWRLSQLTLPHDLARLLLLEQLYRIETIRAGHPYHRS